MSETGHYSRNGFLTSRALREVAQQTSLEGLAPRGELGYLDKVGSVSGSTHQEIHWDDALIEEQYRRFLNGS